VPDIIFDVRIEILTLTNLYLDLHEGILECDIPTCTWPLPSFCISGLHEAKYIFDVRPLVSLYKEKKSNL
jgi:hypothetical protein